MLIERLGEKPKVLSTDDGNEYAELVTYLKDKGIGHKVSVANRDVNALSWIVPSRTGSRNSHVCWRAQELEMRRSSSSGR